MLQLVVSVDSKPIITKSASYNDQADVQMITAKISEPTYTLLGNRKALQAKPP